MTSATLTLSQAAQIVEAIILDNINNGPGKDQLTPILRGEPGLGKTSIPRQIAAKHGLIDKTVIIAQEDPGEFGGLPFPQGDRAPKLKPGWLPDDEGVVIILDEIGQAVMMQQNLAAQVIEERRIGQHKLPNRHAVVGCTNKLTDMAGVQPMPSHVKDRVIILDVRADVDEWLIWAAANGIDERIIGFIGWQGEWLHKFNPQHDAFASPRSWAKASRVLALNLPRNLQSYTLGRTIGEGASTAFSGFLDYFTNLPSFEAIYADPLGHYIPEQKQLKYAVASGLAQRATTRNIRQTIKYLDRWPDQEFAAFAVKMIHARDSSLTKDPEVSMWAATKGAALMT